MSKTKIMSLSVEPEMQDLLKASAKKLGCSVSSLVRNLVNKYLDVLVDDNDEVKVMLRIPAHLKEDPEALRNWLCVKTDALVNALSG